MMLRFFDYLLQKRFCCGIIILNSNHPIGTGSLEKPAAQTAIGCADRSLMRFSITLTATSILTIGNGKESA